MTLFYRGNARSVVIGYIQDMKTDMFDWYGKWLPENNTAAKDFLNELNQGDEVQIQIGSHHKTIGYVSIDSFYDDEINVKVRGQS